MQTYLKSLREAESMSQQDVADKISVSRQYYSFIESGERGLSVDNAKKLAALFGVDWPSFFEDSAQPAAAGE